MLFAQTAVIVILIFGGTAGIAGEVGDQWEQGEVVKQYSGEKRYKRVKRARAVKNVVKTAINAPNGLTRIVAPVTGKTAMVAAMAAQKFQGFINDLERAGYRIGLMGGWRRWGSCRGCNMHPRGLAIDIDQIARNRLARGKVLPVNVSAIAARHGLFHGAAWRNPDKGHFEVVGGRRQWPIGERDRAERSEQMNWVSAM